MKTNLIRTALACAALAFTSIAAFATVTPSSGTPIGLEHCPPGDCLKMCGKQTCGTKPSTPSNTGHPSNSHPTLTNGTTATGGPAGVINTSRSNIKHPTVAVPTGTDGKR